MLALKLIARLVEAALMAAIALIGLGVGLYCLSRLIDLGAARPDRLVHLPRIRDHVGHFLAQLAAPGPVAVVSLVCGLGAIAIGVALLAGELGSRRERLLLVQRDPDGDLYARPRALVALARAATAQTPGITDVRRPRVRLTRSGTRGRLTVLASRRPDSDAAAMDRLVHERLDPIAERLNLEANIRVRRAAPRPPGERRR